MSVTVVEDIKREFVCDRCGKREIVTGETRRPKMGHNEVVVAIHTASRICDGKAGVYVCNSCASELAELVERFFDESNKEEATE